MKEWVLENPKLVVTAFSGLVLFLLQSYVIQIPAEVKQYADIILPAFFLMLIGRFSRITKSEAEVINEMRQ